MKDRNSGDGLYNKLITYAGTDYYPMHMPGHKRNSGLMELINPYEIDITEIEGFDNLHQPEGVLRELSEQLSGLYGAAASFPLVNGSTAGILAGISAASRPGDKVLIARNSHKSVYHAVMLKGLQPVYIYPPMLSQMPVLGGISVSKIEEALINDPEIRLVVITSPTYEGVVSNIKEIAETVHRFGALLLVDEAHGAHLGFHPYFPESAVRSGADLVIQSLHKTLPAFTQTAVLHSNRPELEDRIRKYLAVYQSTSPSYILLAGIDRCVQILKDRGDELFDAYRRHLREFYKAMEALKSLRVTDDRLLGENGVYALDPSKITVSVPDASVTGHELQELLYKEYHIVMEMASSHYVLGMTSICDTREGFRRLAEALLSIDRRLTGDYHGALQYTGKPADIKIYELRPQQILAPQEAFEAGMETIRLTDSAGRISAALICLYPPGSPLLVPGERIEEGMPEYICRVRKEGLNVTGLSGGHKDRIDVLRQ